MQSTSQKSEREGSAMTPGFVWFLAAVAAVLILWPAIKWVVWGLAFVIARYF